MLMTILVSSGVAVVALLALMGPVAALVESLQSKLYDRETARIAATSAADAAEPTAQAEAVL